MNELELLNQRITELENRQNTATNFFDVQGVVRTVTSAPTTAPNKVSDQVVLYIDNIASPTTKRLYIYSTNAKIWSYVALT